MHRELTNPIISVAIPGRNRESELASLIALIDRMKDPRIEFVISDNSDTPLRIWSSNPSCKFVRPRNTLNMTEHWNFALGHTTGKYVVFLGDDDAFLPSELTSLANFLVGTEVDIVRYPRATYEWPKGTSSGNFYQEVRKFRKESLDEQTKKVLSFDYRNLPIPYHAALVNRRVIELAMSKSTDAKFFSTRNPDFNSGAKILFLSKTQIYFPCTVFISGASNTSNGGLNAANPQHPRAEEYRSRTLNPPPDWMPNVDLPVGFIWLYEAVEDAARQLGITRGSQDKMAFFFSVVKSQDPKRQLQISKRMWPKKPLTGGVALALGLGYQALIKSGFLTLIRYSLIVLRVLLGISKVRSIKGEMIMKDTYSLVSFLESSKALESRRGILIIR